MENSLIGICAKKTLEEMFKFLHRGFRSSSKPGILILSAKPVPCVVTSSLLVTGTIKKGRCLVSTRLFYDFFFFNSLVVHEVGFPVKV